LWVMCRSGRGCLMIPGRRFQTRFSVFNFFQRLSTDSDIVLMSEMGRKLPFDVVSKDS